MRQISGICILWFSFATMGFAQSTWVQVDKVTPPEYSNANLKRLGFAMVTEGNYLFAPAYTERGNIAIDIYERFGDDYSFRQTVESPKADESFLFRTLSAWGTEFMVADGQENYIFGLQGNEWKLLAELERPDGSSNSFATTAILGADFAILAYPTDQVSTQSGFLGRA